MNPQYSNVLILSQTLTKTQEKKRSQTFESTLRNVQIQESLNPSDNLIE